MLNALKIRDLLGQSAGSAPTVTPQAVPATPAAPAGPALRPDWSLYLGDGTATGGARDMSGTSAEGWQDALNWVRRYDPNANIQGTVMPGGEGGQYIAYDMSKLPQNITGGVGISGIARGTPGSGERLANPNAVATDPIYGRVTSPANLMEKGPSMVDILGPLVVAAATGIGAGGLGALFGGGAASNPIGAGVANGLQGLGRNIGNGNWMGALMSALPIAGGAAGIPSYLTRGATTLGQLALGGKKPLGGG